MDEPDAAIRTFFDNSTAAIDPSIIQRRVFFAARIGPHSDGRIFVSDRETYPVARFTIEKFKRVLFSGDGLPIDCGDTIADLDIDGRYIVLTVPAIGIGAMTGPGIAGVLSQSGDFGSLLAFVGITVVVSAVLIAVSAVKARPAPAPVRI